MNNFYVGLNLKKLFLLYLEFYWLKNTEMKWEKIGLQKHGKKFILLQKLAFQSVFLNLKIFFKLFYFEGEWEIGKGKLKNERAWISCILGEWKKWLIEWI